MIATLQLPAPVHSREEAVNAVHRFIESASLAVLASLRASAVPLKRESPPVIRDC